MTISSIIVLLAQLLTLAIILRAVLSWFPYNRTLAPAQAFLAQATEPIIRPIRNHLPALGGLDLSPLVAILLIGVLESLTLNLLRGY